MRAPALRERWIPEEILQQPAAVARTIAGRTRGSVGLLKEAGLTAERVRGLSRVVIVGSGSAYHAALVARYAITEWARIQCESDLASEWRDRNPILRGDTLVVGLSHSGGDEDTLEALRIARDRDAWTVAITEMSASRFASEADGMLATQAGAESG